MNSIYGILILLLLALIGSAVVYVVRNYSHTVKNFFDGVPEFLRYLSYSTGFLVSLAAVMVYVLAFGLSVGMIVSNTVPWGN